MTDKTGVVDQIDMRAIERIARHERAKAFARAGAWLGAQLSPLVAPLRRHAAYVRTCQEMELLDDRSLRDIGVSRLDIPAIARRAALRQMPRFGWRERAELARLGEDVAVPGAVTTGTVRRAANDAGVPKVPLARRTAA
ncbi:hypothetical protein CKO28_00515 [Rhodovibrio sodomensis]|uniref:YjiS-like domain-containing protein n=1 Tax=Rhodovibrio sodomensis TaxID=1088 RepID=A0ABS1D7X0_9PROT|nr:DUF1127 domain-containing protein [Rhodovibrio sodomensis]MBK1666523.1 hypothetical protein [Rhodovibrio sodomensis]